MALKREEITIASPDNYWRYFTLPEGCYLMAPGSVSLGVIYESIMIFDGAQPFNGPAFNAVLGGIGGVSYCVERGSLNVLRVRCDEEEGWDDELVATVLWNLIRHAPSIR